MSKDKKESGTTSVQVPLLPINGRIIVLPEEKQKVTATGLYLADTSSSSDKPQIGIVIRVGLERTDDEGNKITFNVKEGMKVMFSRYAGEPIEYDGKKYLLMEEKDIMAIYED